jgi:hypothetical protein
MVRSMRECIRGTEVLPRDMLEGEVVFQESAVPSSLMACQLLCRAEVSEVLVISKNNDGVGVP